MAYKPRLTPILACASQSNNWAPIGGVEAMIEQGLAQARMWAASAKILKQLEVNPEMEAESPADYAGRAGDDGPLGKASEDDAREMVLAMQDIVVPVSTPSTTTTTSTPNTYTSPSTGPQFPQPQAVRV